MSPPQAVNQFKADKLDYDETMLRHQAVEQIKNMKVMQWLQANVQVEVLPYSKAA